MLMQLVCVDRRYQRMNCFNVRELQGNLKRKFFTYLVNSNDHRDFLNQSILGMRFKTNNNLAVTPDMEAFYNFGTTKTSKVKTFEFINVYSDVNTYFSSIITNLVNIFSMPNVNLFNLFPNVTLYLKSVVDVITSINVYSLSTTFSISHITTDLISSNLTHFNFFSTKQTSLNESTTLRASLKETTFYNSENITNRLR